ncbi:MAG TPA: translation initiation factor IF-3 [Actinomycetota bacterium]|nr:translation initiation factor IF-3 [Actinomycetota bacterium]
MNERIRTPQVRLVGPDGTQIGIVPIQEALRRAREMDLDLVEVAPQAQPPVCRIMDYGKYKYERDIRQKEARKRQARVEVKEIKMRPKIDRHDYEIKKGHVVRFLQQGARVKVTIMFRGREMAHTELGQRLLDRLAEDVRELGTVEAYPKLDGRNMVMILAPVRRPAPRAARVAEPAGGRERPPEPAAEGPGGGDRPSEPAAVGETERRE